MCAGLGHVLGVLRSTWGARIRPGKALRTLQAGFFVVVVVIFFFFFAF